MTTMQATGTAIAADRLTEIETELQAVMTQASQQCEAALDSCQRAGGLLQEAQSIYGENTGAYRAWLDKQQIARDKERILITLHANWPQIQERIHGQTLLPFAEVRRLAAPHPRPEIGHGAAFDRSISIPDEAYEVPEGMKEDFHYPDEEQEDSHTPAADILAGIFRFVVPRRLEKPEDWRTVCVRVVGLAYLAGVVHDDVSIRNASDAIGVSHATISKYLRKLSDELGIRSPRQKRESTRATYSQVQTENHWRRRE